MSRAWSVTSTNRFFDRLPLTGVAGSNHDFLLEDISSSLDIPTIRTMKSDKIQMMMESLLVQQSQFSKFISIESSLAEATVLPCLFCEVIRPKTFGEFLNLHAGETAYKALQIFTNVKEIFIFVYKTNN
jgi:hypothetical protein